MNNIKSITHTYQQKENSCINNKIILDYAYHLSNGFFLKQQLLFIISIIEHIPMKQLNSMISDLCNHGLLIQKQVTTTKTNLFVMNKFSLSHYVKYDTRDTTSIKLNNTKIWTNIFRLEFLIQEILPNLTSKIDNLTELLTYLNDNFIDIFRVANQEDVCKFYIEFYKKFPVKNKIDVKHLPPKTEFTNDYLASIEEYRIYLTNFKKEYEKAERYKGYEHYKSDKDLNAVFFNTPIEKNKHCYNLYQMKAQGFFFKSSVINNNVNIGLFDIYTHLSLRKIYTNSIFILLMLIRYLGFTPILNITIYVKDFDTKRRLEKEESMKNYNYLDREVCEYNKKTGFFYRLGCMHLLDNINVEYKVYELESKYKL